ncbi:MAG: hypothetical protein EOP22_04560 [Hyphomicrobiales bacterium]|nr:MAG: hypothetical protein EOP22_04560 [Hyphomicrobiales bacterium]
MSHSHSSAVEYLTIVAPTAAEAMAQFAKRGLGAQGFTIAGKIGRHHIAVVIEGKSADLLRGDGMVAATFQRTIHA